MAPLTPLGLIRILGHVSAIMVIPMVGGAVAGILLDRAHGTSPLFVLSGFAIGNVVAFTGIWLYIRWHTRRGIAQPDSGDDA
ncbi:MAG TPA: AtpZ/AtpI family protein [Candidatus Saccharimonadales bacterium]|jgi:F0F1-type ATP synthase assembly protein I|nr:AtpZ/AtpI family protein [Candidatus Saccharimonadales bacterium]